MSSDESGSESESESASASGADAIALFRPKNKSMILPFLDLDDSEESDGLYAEELEDGSFLVHTFQPFDVFDQNPDEARVWLKQFGVALPEVHDDPRGLFFFSDDDEPEATTYDGVVKEIGDGGLWVATSEVLGADVQEGDDEEEEEGEGEGEGGDLQQMLASMMGGGAGGMPGINMDMLQKFAGQMMSNMEPGEPGEGGEPGAAPKAVSSFEVGQLFEQMQRGLLDQLSGQQQPEQQAETDETAGDVIDEEFAPDPPADPAKKK